MRHEDDERDQDSVKEIKVTDRRMFTADGELRVSQDDGSEAGDDSAAGNEVDPQSTPTEPAPWAPSMGAAPLAAPGFAELVSMLAEPVALFLGDIELPNGESAQDLDLARFHIDLLGVLQEKTRSNLSREEAAALDDLLYGLRMRYVQKSQ